MGRGRIPMELIEKEKTRKTTFQKRKNGLMKKVYEFSTLCGVDVCVIMYAPNFDGQGFAEPETWPKDTTKVQRIIQKYYDTTSDRRPKMYDVQEYYKDRMKKIEGEICKLRKEKLKILYPTWDDTFNHLGEEQLRMFATMLDAKLDACNQKINILKGDHDHDLRGKAIADYQYHHLSGGANTVSRKSVTLTPPYLASNPMMMNHLNDLMMQNMSPVPAFPPPPMNNYMMKSIYNENQLAFFPFQFGQSSQPSLFHFGENYMQLMGNNEAVDWANNDQVAYDPTTGMLKDSGAENNEDLLPPCYYNGNMQPYSIGLHTQKSEGKIAAGFLSLSDAPPPPPPPGFQLNGFYDASIVQPHNMFSDMHGTMK